MGNQPQKYNSTIAGKGTLIPEIKKALGEIAQGRSEDQLRKDIIENDLLDRKTYHTRKKIWEEIYRRYISGRKIDQVRTLAKFSTYCRNQTAVDFLFLYNGSVSSKASRVESALPNASTQVERTSLV